MTLMDTLQLAFNVAKVITNQLEMEKISIATASKKTGIPRTTLLRRLENPETSPFTVTELQKLAELTSTTVSSIVIQAEQALAGGEKQ